MSRSRPDRVRWTLRLALAIAAAAPPATAQELGERPPGFSRDEPPSSFYTLESEPVRAGMVLHGRTRLEGIAPLTIPGDLSGPFRLDVRAPGFAAQRAFLFFPGSGGPLELRSSAGTGARALVAALVWPGAAQLERGGDDAWRGFGFAAAGVAGAGGLIAAELRRRDAEETAADARAVAAAAPSLGERTDALLAAARGDAEADRAAAARTDWALVMAAAWSLSLLDTYWLAPRLGDARLDLTELTFTLHPLRRPRAVMRSFVPGFGQYHAGRTRAGALAFLGGLGATAGLLAAEHAYEDAVYRLAAAEALYNDPLADPEAVARYRSAVEDEAATAADHRRTRNVMAAVAGGVWVANLLDAALATPAPAAPAGAKGDRPPRALALTAAPAPGIALRLVF